MTTAAEAIIDLYERTARAWDEARRRARPEDESVWIERFLSIADPDLPILDLGCGSGEPIARDILAAGRQLIGVDSAPSMISICRDRFATATWIVEDMRRLRLGDCFGGIIAWHSFFHLTADDQEQMFAQFAAHASPGAALMFTSGTQRGEAIGNWQGEPLYHASLDTDEYATLLARHGFSIVDHVSGASATVWLAQFSDVR
jgi:ubiquinone/menaquinone biosynthesis C-methylase UbiE